ncbi:hypothetical protein [Halopseudomonas litoralis]|uniref:hypothetical protein n=1 Tax=Halopseudomonas litoralis TaxID=797277 RepID=UPI000B7CE3C4|nr:hypothetical protein [Halopseudomonas litoralis]
MIQNSPEEAIANKYFAQANGPVAFLLVSLGYTALQFEYPQPFACFAIAISSIWLFSVGGPYRSILKVYLPKGAPASRYIFVLWRLKVFIVSLCFTIAIAQGMNVVEIYSLMGYPISQ